MNVHTRPIAILHKQRQQEADEADDKRTQKRRSETGDMKSDMQKARDPAGKHQHESVDHEREQPEGEDKEREREQLQQRAHARVEYAEHKCDHK